MLPAKSNYDITKDNEWLSKFDPFYHCCTFSGWNDFYVTFTEGTFFCCPLGVFCIVDILGQHDHAMNSKAAPTIYCNIYSVNENIIKEGFISLYYVVSTDSIKYARVHIDTNRMHYTLGSITEIL